MAVNTETCSSKLILKYTMYTIVRMLVLIEFVRIRDISVLLYFYSGQSDSDVTTSRNVLLISCKEGHL
jgi:hypothetical protein